MASESKSSVKQEPALLYSASVMLQIHGIADAVLSLGSYEPIQQKELLSGNHAEFGRKTVEDHLEAVFSERERSGRPIGRGAPLLVVSVRNVLANLRCGAYVRGKTAGFITVREENRVRSVRPYHVLARRGNAFEMRELDVTKEGLDEYAWLVSGVPVLWDDMIFERILTEAADHAHVFELPRGNHPQATEETRARWQKLHEVFSNTLGGSRSQAFAELMREAGGLKRESRYLHNAIGLDARGNLKVLVSLGRLEDLGERLRAAGTHRAIVVDNGGSTSVSFYPDGMDGGCITLLQAPNHRPLGTAYLVLVLSSKYFEAIPEF